MEKKITITLDKSDKHFVGLFDPSGCVKDIGDWYESNCGAVKFSNYPSVVIYVPEVRKLKYPRMRVRIKVTKWSWYILMVFKSKDMRTWKRIYTDTSQAGAFGLDVWREVLIDSEYPYYKIVWKDGRYENEKAYLYKKVTIVGFEEEPATKPSPSVTSYLMLAAAFVAGMGVGYFLHQ